MEWRCANQVACEKRCAGAEAESTTDTGGGYASAAAVAGLAREVEALRTSVGPLSGVAEEVTRLARAVEELAAQPHQHGPAGAPSWLTLPAEMQVVAEVLGQLVEWLGEVYLRYEDAARGLPECWLWHPAVVEELLWLMHAWLVAYQSEKATAQLAGDWHDRYRPGVVRRIKDTTGKCALEKHQGRPGERLPGAPVVPLTEALAPIADWWAVDRHEAAPEPDDTLLDAAARLPGRGGRR